MCQTNKRRNIIGEIRHLSSFSSKSGTKTASFRRFVNGRLAPSVRNPSRGPRAGEEDWTKRATKSIARRGFTKIPFAIGRKMDTIWRKEHPVVTAETVSERGADLFSRVRCYLFVFRSWIPVPNDSKSMELTRAIIEPGGPRLKRGTRKRWYVVDAQGGIGQITQIESNLKK